MVRSLLITCACGAASALDACSVAQPHNEAISTLQTTPVKVHVEQSTSHAAHAEGIRLPEHLFDRVMPEQLRSVLAKRAAAQESVKMVKFGEQRQGSRCTLQVGEPRSASTLQFTALCLAKLLLHPGEDVQCEYESKLKTCKDGHGLVVSKDNFPDSLGSRIQDMLGDGQAEKYFEMFMSVRNNPDFKESAENLASQLHLTVQNTQTMSSLEASGILVVNEYQSIYNLDDDAMNKLRSVLGNWSILRQCCGAQMSSDAWKDLQGNDADRHWDESSKTYPACDSYNMDEIQTELMDQPLWWDLVHAADDGQRLIDYYTRLTPAVSYLNCSRTNAYVAEHTEIGWNVHNTFHRDLYDDGEDER